MELVVPPLAPKKKKIPVKEENEGECRGLWKSRKREGDNRRGGSETRGIKDVDVYRASDRGKAETSRGWRSDESGRKIEPRVAWREQRVDRGEDAGDEDRKDRGMRTRRRKTDGWREKRRWCRE